MRLFNSDVGETVLALLPGYRASDFRGPTAPSVIAARISYAQQHDSPGRTLPGVQGQVIDDACSDIRDARMVGIKLDRARDAHLMLGFRQSLFQRKDDAPRGGHDAGRRSFIVVGDPGAIGQPFPRRCTRGIWPESAFSDFAVRRTGHIHLPELSGGPSVNHPRKAAPRKWGGYYPYCSPGHCHVFLGRSSGGDSGRRGGSDRRFGRHGVRRARQRAYPGPLHRLRCVRWRFSRDGDLGAMADRHRSAGLVACRVRGRLVKVRGANSLGNAPLPPTAYRRQPGFGRKTVAAIHRSYRPTRLVAPDRHWSEHAPVRRRLSWHRCGPHSPWSGLRRLDDGSGQAQANQVARLRGNITRGSDDNTNAFLWRASTGSRY